MASDHPTAVQGPRLSRVTNRLQVLKVGDVLNDTYELRELVAQTIEADVFVAIDLLLGREVAIKTVAPDTGFEQLRREARMLASFEHPGVVSIHGYGTHAGIEYLVLEPLRGTSLATYLDLRSGRGGFSASETIEILLGIAEALAVIHAAGALHGRLTAESVVIASGARIVLRELSTVEGAPGHGPDPHDDLRALGTIGFQLLTGSPGRVPAARVAVAHLSPTHLASPVGPIIRDLLAAEREISDVRVVAASLRAIRGAAHAAREGQLAIVVADDDPAMRDLLRLVLAHAAPSAALHFAAHGVEAIELVERVHPDLVFLDIDMPSVNGLEVCAYLRGASAFDRLAICVMSQYATENRAALARLGVLDVFQKGELDPEALANAVGTLLRKIRVMPEPPPVAQVIDGGLVGGRYEVGRQLGQGGMGSVYEARHARLGKKFALKIINSSYALDATARARFNEEAKLASEIEHPNIVSVIDYGEDPKVGAYMVMELVQGRSLGEVAHERLSLRRACELLGQIADALEQIHARGIVHGDVKAENIMVVDDAYGGRRKRVARLLDFGLARRITRMLHGDLEVVVGTPHYLAPECCTGTPVSVASDVYALGVLGYLLLAGTIPFDGPAERILVQHVREYADPIARRRGEPVDPALQNLISRAMAKAPEARHPTAAAFRYELGTAVAMLGLEAKLGRTTERDLSKDAQLVRLFTRSTVAQAILSTGGTFVAANELFLELGEGDPRRVLERAPGLARAVEEARRDGGPVQWSGVLESQPRRQLAVSVLPLWTSTREVHLIARVVSA